MASVFKGINPNDIRIAPFQAYKKWSGTSSSLYTLYEGVYKTQADNLGAPTVASTDYSSGKLKRSIHNSIDHLFYREFYNNTKAVFGSGNPDQQDRQLYDFATVLSLPQSKVGEGILPGSVRLEYKLQDAVTGYTDSSTVVIVDDGKGNLVYESNADATGSVTTLYDWNGNTVNTFGQITPVPVKNHVFRLQTERLLKNLNATTSGSFYNAHNTWNTAVEYNNIKPVTGDPSEGSTTFQPNRGVRWYFNGNTSSSVRLIADGENINKQYNFINTDYSIGFFLYFDPLTPAGVTQSIIEKKDVVELVGSNSKGVLKNNISRYPYKIELRSNGGGICDLYFLKSNGYKTISQYIGEVADDRYVWLSRSGKTYHAGIYKSADTTPFIATDFTDTLDDTKCANKADIWIGSNASYTNNLQGWIDGFSIFNKGYDNVTYGNNVPGYQQFSFGTNTPNVGNVYYKQGLLCLTNEFTYDRTYGYDTGSGACPLRLEYRSTQTIYETQVNCRIDAGEFEFTNNPTAHEYDTNTNQDKLRGFATSSGFKPYVTQVGLYDDIGNLLVVGKLSQAMQTPSDISTTFVLKFDR